MSASFRGGLSNAQITFTETPASGLFNGISQPYPNQRIQALFTPGTAADQVDGVCEMILNLAASTPQTINLLTGLTDLNGTALTVAHISFLAIKNLSTTDGQTVLVGNAASNPFEGFVSGINTLSIYPSSSQNDGFLVLAAPNMTGIPVNSTSCNLKFDPGTNAVSVLLVVGTRSV